MTEKKSPIITLDEPLTAPDGRTITQASMRRPKVRDDIQAAVQSGTNEEREVRFFGILADIPYEVMKEMDLQDYAKFQEKYREGNFTSNQPSSGSPPSTSAESSASPGTTS